MARLLIRSDEMILLKNSEAGKNCDLYGNLYDVLQDYRVLSDEEFKKNQLFDDKARAVILNNKKILIDEIKEEWVAIGYSDEATNEVRCQLCNTKNKFVYYIHNKSNETDLNVGSECIKKFPGIGNFSQVKRTRNEMVKKQSEAKRRIEFDGIDLDDINFIKNSEEWFVKFKILLPYKLYNDIKSGLYNLNSIKTLYIRNGGDIKEVTKQYFEFKSILKKHIQEAEDIYQKNKSNRLVCKKGLADWLKDNNIDIWEGVMKNDGILAEDTLKYCYYKEFVQANLKNFNQCILDKDITIIGMNGNSIRFAIKNSEYTHSLSFTVKSDVFMKEIGCYCLTNKTYRFGKKELTCIFIEQTPNNFEAMCNRIKRPLEKVGLSIERGKYSNDVYYVRLPRVIRTSKSGNKSEKCEIGYKIVAEVMIYEKVGNLIFESDAEFEKVFGKIYNQLNRGTWISKEEKDRMDEISKSLSIRTQREFIPYA